MKIKILEKCVTPSNSFKKGQEADIRGADAAKLVEAGKAEYTAEGKKEIEASEQALKARKEAKSKKAK